MTVTVTALYRHPIKSVGSEALDTVTLLEGETMPWDRTWAVMHENSKTDGSAWARCLNFLRVASSPSLAAVRAQLDTERETLVLSHPERPDLTVQPDTEQAKLTEWLTPLVDPKRSQPTAVARVPGRGMTDTAFPSISIANMSTHRAVGQKLGHELSLLRWRSNIWLDGLAPWEEFDWVGRDLRIGNVRFKIEERIERCNNILANPDTGRRDLDVLGTLESWGHQNFSVAAVVTEGGDVTVGDEMTLL